MKKVRIKLVWRDSREEVYRLSINGSPAQYQQMVPAHCAAYRWQMLARAQEKYMRAINN